MLTYRPVLPIIALATAVASGCGRPDEPLGIRAEPSLATAAASEADAREQPAGTSAADATYSGIYDNPVTLQDGTHEGEPFVDGGAARPRLSLTPGFTLSGDLDGDGNDETLVFLEENSGGTGRFVYVAVLSNTAQGLVNTATAMVGDRVQIRGATIEDDRLSLHIVQAGPEDAACCPSQKANRHWRYVDSGLVEEEAEITGTLSVADLEGPEWALLGFGAEESLPLESPITLLVYGDKVGGFGGCNRYMGSVKEGQGAGSIEFGPLAGTMMACPEPQMELESRYLTALQRSGNFGFQAGRMVILSVNEEGQMTKLLFEARPSGDTAD